MTRDDRDQRGGHRPPARRSGRIRHTCHCNSCAWERNQRPRKPRSTERQTAITEQEERA